MSGPDIRGFLSLNRNKNRLNGNMVGNLVVLKKLPFVNSDMKISPGN